jgi:multidrug efflux pump subunit AcrA (membrane-fusion protein)
VDAYAVIAADGAQTPLRPGAFVRVRVADRRYENVIQAPESALYGEDTVFVVNAEQRLEARKVRVAGYAGSNMLIASAGDPPLRDGDRLLTTQLREIGAGVKVQLR